MRKVKLRIIGLVISFSVASLGVTFPGETRAVSIQRPGLGPTGGSINARLSGDGVHIAFASDAKDLVLNDTNGFIDVFVTNVNTGVNSLLSVSTDGTKANNGSVYADCSYDGTICAFSSQATNLVPNDTNGVSDVFVRNFATNTTERVSIAINGGLPNGSCYLVGNSRAISSNGRYVLFCSSASNLVLGDDNNVDDVFRYDRWTNSTEIVSVNNGVLSNRASTWASLSANGRYVVYVTGATNFGVTDSNNTADTYVRDMQGSLSQCVSVTSLGTTGNNASSFGAISDDGRFVTFSSTSSNLVSGDTNNREDIFVRDRQQNLTQIASVTPAGNPGNGISAAPSISTDGRFVAFMSAANNLVAGDSNSRQDVFQRDLTLNTTRFVSFGIGGTSANAASTSSCISEDGNFVAFTSSADNLVNNDSNRVDDLFLMDKSNNSIVRTSTDNAPFLGNQDTPLCNLSEDGRWAIFISRAYNLVPGDSNNFYNIFLRDLLSGDTEIVDRNNQSEIANNSSGTPTVSPDARYCAFQSQASNLVAGDTNNALDVFVRDRQLGTIQRVSIGSSGSQSNASSYFPRITDDSQLVLFFSDATNLVPGDTNAGADIFLRDIQASTTRVVSTNSAGVLGNSGSSECDMTSDARFVVFSTLSTNLFPGDTNAVRDIVLKDLSSGQTQAMSVSSNEVLSNGTSQNPSVSGDGNRIVFESDATNLVSGDANGFRDIFLKDRTNGTITLVSITTDGVQANGGSRIPKISKDGRYVAFESVATNLVVGDTNANSDVFVHDTETGNTTCASLNSDGVIGNSYSISPRISADGQHVTFSSFSNNLVPVPSHGIYLQGYIKEMPNFESMITGLVSLRDYVGPRPTPDIQFELVRITSGRSLRIPLTSLSSSGAFAFLTDALGQFELYAKGPTFLRRLYSSVLTLNHSTISNIVLELINGDCDGDNEISLTDVGIISAAFDSTASDPNWDIRADLNGDELVNLADHAIVIAGFGLLGD